jgi:hypothetical protein
MDISKEEAQVSLNLVQDTQTRLKKAVAAGYASGLLVLWGGIWIVGFASLHFSDRIGGHVFAALDVVGFIATVLIARRWPHNTVIRGPEFRTVAWQCTGLWLSLSVYGLIWALLLRPANGRALGVFLCTLCMFGYVVMGLWRRSLFLIGLGLAITAMSLAGFYWLPGYFYLWMAATGGGALLGAGLYIRRWR